MALCDVLGSRLLLGDCAMGTMIQQLDVPAVSGNDVLNLTHPEEIKKIHAACLAAGSDWIETNTFGANLSLADYGLAGSLADINRAGAELARLMADAATGQPRYVLGSMGPGNKLPTLSQIGFAAVRDAAATAAGALVSGGADGLIIETCQDLLQAKATVIGARRAVGRGVPIIVSVTIESGGAMLLGTPVDAAVAALAHLGIDAIGLNCAVGPDLMEQPLRQLSKLSPLPIFVMPNAGLPELGPDGARYPLKPDEFASAMAHFAQTYGVASVAGCCGTTPEHIAAAHHQLTFGDVQPRDVPPVDMVSSLYEAVTVRQEISYLAIGERANVSGSKAFRDALAAEDWDQLTDIARGQTGAHMIDLCVDQTGRDTVADMRALASRVATTVTAPVMLDSSKPAVLAAGLECLPGRCVVNSVNLEDAAKYEVAMTSVAEHGAAVVALTIDEAGLATTCERKLAVAHKLIDDLTGRWGLNPADIFVDLLTYPVSTGAEDARAAAAETIEALRQLMAETPGVGTILGVSNVSFGLTPAARVVLNSVFLDECRQAGLDAAIIDPAKIRPLHLLPPEQVAAAHALLMNDRTAGDPLAAFMALFDDAAPAVAPVDALAALPLHERLTRRIVDAIPSGLEADLDEALTKTAALDIINDDLLEGMRQVGALFGQGLLQLPFVLASAEVMRKAVDHLAPSLESVADAASRGTFVLATVAGDVHDIGKNLVDIIASNNGYKVINLGVRVPIETMIEAAISEDALAIGMSGLLVKSAEVMRDNLAELTRAGLAARFPVILGGAALSSAYVESLRADYPRVYYAADAFDDLHILADLARQTAPPSPVPPATKPVVTRTIADELPRSSTIRGGAVPPAPFLGVRRERDITIDDVAPWLDRHALLLGRWGMRTTPGETFDQLAAQMAPRIDAHMATIGALADFGVNYGFWPAYSDGDDLVLLDPDDADEAGRFHFARQKTLPYLCIADYFRDQDEMARCGPDVAGLQLVTIGPRVAEAAAGLFAAGHYRDYLEILGLAAQLAEALAQMWHARMRGLLGIGDAGQRYSFGYPACPDLSQRAALFGLLDGADLGLALSETYQLIPEQSTDALVVHHPDARLFFVR